MMDIRQYVASNQCLQLSWLRCGRRGGGYGDSYAPLRLQVRPCRSSAVRRWLPTAAARVRVRAACGICGGQSDTGAGFLRILGFPLPIIPPISPIS
jgi:hypothetical protein